MITRKQIKEEANSVQLLDGSRELKSQIIIFTLLQIGLVCAFNMFEIQAWFQGLIGSEYITPPIEIGKFKRLEFSEILSIFGIIFAIYIGLIVAADQQFKQYKIKVGDLYGAYAKNNRLRIQRTSSDVIDAKERLYFIDKIPKNKSDKSNELTIKDIGFLYEVKQQHWYFSFVLILEYVIAQFIGTWYIARPSETLFLSQKWFTDYLVQTLIVLLFVYVLFSLTLRNNRQWFILDDIEFKRDTFKYYSKLRWLGFSPTMSTSLGDVSFMLASRELKRFSTWRKDSLTSCATIIVSLFMTVFVSLLFNFLVTFPFAFINGIGVEGLAVSVLVLCCFQLCFIVAIAQVFIACYYLRRKVLPSMAFLYFNVALLFLSLAFFIVAVFNAATANSWLLAGVVGFVGVFGGMAGWCFFYRASCYYLSPKLVIPSQRLGCWALPSCIVPLWIFRKWNDRNPFDCIGKARRMPYIYRIIDGEVTVNYKIAVDYKIPMFKFRYFDYWVLVLMLLALGKPPEQLKSDGGSIPRTDFFG